MQQLLPVDEEIQKELGPLSPELPGSFPFAVPMLCAEKTENHVNMLKKADMTSQKTLKQRPIS